MGCAPPGRIVLVPSKPKAERKEEQKKKNGTKNNNPCCHAVSTYPPIEAYSISEQRLFEVAHLFSRLDIAGSQVVMMGEGQLYSQIMLHS